MSFPFVWLGKSRIQNAKTKFGLIDMTICTSRPGDVKLIFGFPWRWFRERRLHFAHDSDMEGVRDYVAEQGPVENTDW